MPANPNLLPRPCPKCDSDFGTVVIIDTHKGLRVRIGHYNKSARKKAVKKGLTVLEKNEGKKLETKIKNSERKWCTFTSLNNWLGDLDSELFAALMEGKYHGPSRKDPPHIIKLTNEWKEDFLNHVKENGWAMKKSRKLKKSK